MAIFSNHGSGPIPIETADTLIYQPSVERYAVTALNIHDITGSGGQTISFYISPDTTSASGLRVFEYTLAADEEKDVNSIIGQGYENLNIIAVASNVGAVAQITVTEYTESS